MYQPTIIHTQQDMITRNQRHLVNIGVSHPELDRVVDECDRRGFTTKLTGAGGGGCAFSLIAPSQ